MCSASVEFLATAICHGGHHVDTTTETTKAATRPPSRNIQISLRETGAGEGIRTLDFNLGKVADIPASLAWPSAFLLLIWVRGSWPQFSSCAGGVRHRTTASPSRPTNPTSDIRNSRPTLMAMNVDSARSRSQSCGSHRNARRSLVQARNSQLDGARGGGGEGPLSACSLSHCRKRGSKSA